MNILKEELRIRYRDVNREGDVKAANWFGFMQEIAVDHAAALHFGYHEMAELNLFWVLSRLRLEIKRQPKVEENITLETWPGSFNRLFAARHFRFLDKENNEIAVASSQWMTLSTSNNRPQRVSIIGDRIPDTSSLPAYFDFPQKMVQVAPEGKGLDFPIRYSMEDVNGHLNNAEYMTLAQNAVEETVGRPVEFSGLEVNFNSAVCAPEHLTIYTKPDGSDYLVSGYRQDGTLSFCAAIRGVKNTLKES